MGKPLGFEKPLGMRDLLPPVLARKKFLEERLLNTFERWGYREIQTPTLEYYDTVGGASPTLDDRLFKLLDRQGKTLVLRPDMTGPIARVAASLLKDEPFPLRLSYRANVFRAQEIEAGRNAEFYQTGVELIGIPTVDADAEVISLAVASLQEAGVAEFKIAIGHFGFLEGLLAELVPEEEDRERLKGCLNRRDYVGFRHLVQSLPIGEGDKRRLHGLLKLRGGAQLLTEAAALTKNGKARAAVAELEELWQALAAYEVTDFVLFDLNLVSNLHYYTGILFEGYAAELGFPICSGGRYDSLMAQFGRPAPATGFALKMDRLLEASPLKSPDKRKKVLLAYTKEARIAAIRRAQQLRAEDGVSVETRLLRESGEDLRGIESRYDTVLRMEGEQG
ncbi:ATP phosphoribosyltransferase regulatory subunit [Bacillaceae bacterium]